MKYLFGLLIGLTLFSCGSSTSTNENGEVVENNFVIEGTIKGASAKKVRLQAASQQGTILVAETTTDESGNYTLEGNVPGMGIYTLQIGEETTNVIVLPLEPKDEVILNGSLDKFAVSPKLSGTRWAKPLMTYMRLFSEFTDNQMRELPKIKDPAEQIKKFTSLKVPLENFVLKQVNAEPGNPVNIVLTSILFPSQEMGIANWNPKNLEALKKMELAFSKEHSGSPLSSMLSQQVSQIAAEYQNYVSYNSGDLSAPEIALPNTSGNEMRLSALKGKVVLVDFWASWCGPCRKENPNVVRLYKAHKKEGFEVFSVSLDEDATAWKKAIEKDGLIWPNHVSDLKGWETPLTQVYGFNAIPYTVLLNRAGKIVGVGLRGEELEQKLLVELAKK